MTKAEGLSLLLVVHNQLRNEQFPFLEKLQSMKPVQSHEVSHSASNFLGLSPARPLDGEENTLDSSKFHLTV